MSRHEREVVPVSRHEREVVPVSRHERETVTTSHYDDFALRRRPSISMTFHYDETFSTRSPRHTVRGEKLRELSVPYFFVWRITLMLSRIFSEPLMSISNKHNYKTLSKSPPPSLLQCIRNILSHSSGTLSSAEVL